MLSAIEWRSRMAKITQVMFARGHVKRSKGDSHSHWTIVAELITQHCHNAAEAMLKMIRSANAFKVACLRDDPLVNRDNSISQVVSDLSLNADFHGVGLENKLGDKAITKIDTARALCGNTRARRTISTGCAAAIIKILGIKPRIVVPIAKSLFPRSSRPSRIHLMSMLQAV